MFGSTLAAGQSPKWQKCEEKSQLFLDILNKHKIQDKDCSLKKTLNSKSVAVSECQTVPVNELSKDFFQNTSPTYNSFVTEVSPNGVRAKFTKISSTIDEDSRDFFKANILVTQEKALNIFTATIKQYLCPAWHNQRKNRISASVAHKLLRARTSQNRIKYFIDKIPDNKNFKYGRDTEPEAKEKFCELFGVEVYSSGLIVKPNQPWLCASPDGFFKDETGNLCLLEIKCPSSCSQLPKPKVDYISE